MYFIFILKKSNIFYLIRFLDIFIISGIFFLMKIMSTIKCPYCKSDLRCDNIGTPSEQENFIWECGTTFKFDGRISHTPEPTKECKTLMDERMKVKLTDVSQYVAGLKEFEELFPDAIPKTDLHKKIDTLEERIDPKKKEIMDLLERLSNDSVQ